MEIPQATPPSPSCGRACALCGAAACALCVCCPLALLWCAVRMPVLLAWGAARRAWSGHGPRRRGRLVEVSSSFSDMDLDAELVEPVAEIDRHRDRGGRCFRWVGRRDRSRLSSAP